jgi:hypothetical protein
VRPFEPGEAIALREIWHRRVGAVRPAIVVADTSRLTMLYVPIGSRWLGPDHPRPWVELKAPGAEWQLTEFTWTDTHVLSFAWPGAGHALLHAWDAEWRPLLWYLNIQAPLQRSELGFDTFDHDLDVVIEPDGSAWHWKDEDDVADGVRLGVYTNDDVRAFRREGERGIRRILDREPPFDRDWGDWRPDPSWPVPTLPEGWDVV